MTLHRERNSSPGCLAQHVKDGFGRLSENLDACCGVQRLFVCASRTLADHSHVELKGVRVRMNLHDSDLCSLVVHVLVESDKTWFICCYEVNQPRDASSLSLKFSRLESVRRNEDERTRHRTPPSVTGTYERHRRSDCLSASLTMRRSSSALAL